MIRDWTKHLKTEEEKKKYEASLRNSKFVLERLEEMYKERLDQLDNSEMSSTQYENVSWAYKQADRIGRRSEIRGLLKLIDLDNRSRTNG